MEKAGFAAKRSAPPSGLLGFIHSGFNNFEELKVVLGSNKGFLLDTDDVWRGPRGTLPFWNDRDLKANYTWAMSRSPPKKFDLWWDPSCSMAQMMDFGGVDAVYVTARLEYFVAFVLDENEHTRRPELRWLSPCRCQAR